jgi:Xaa-Pro aminopeptidase
MKLDMEERITRVSELFGALGAEAALITAPENIRYLSGFTGSNGTLYISANRRLLVTDQRYGNQAKLQAPGWEVVVHELDRDRSVARLVSGMPERVVAYEDLSLTVGRFFRLREASSLIQWIPFGDSLPRIRAVKDEDEIELIRKSVRIAEAGYSTSSETLIPGIAEASVAAEMEYRMKLAGSEAAAFPTIVAAGEHSAYPHAESGRNAIMADDLVTIDWGAVVGGYHSDLTRVVRFGAVDAERESLLSLTLEAFDAAMNFIEPGVTGAELDAAARGIFIDAGMEDKSLRGLGHGVGLEIHENPRIVMGSSEKLLPGMVFTIEPGLYVPGVGGVRVEHTVLLTENGPEVLSDGLPLVIEGSRE